MYQQYGCKINAYVKEFIAIKKINAVQNFNARKKLRKPAVPAVNPNITKSNVSRR